MHGMGVRVRGSSLLGLSLLGKNSPTIFGLSQIRWCKKSLFSIFPTSIFGLDKIRWYEKACLALALHPFSVSTKYDGMKKACLALALHPFSVSTNSDGAPDKKCSNSHHRFSASTESDGAPAKNAQIRYIHLPFQSNPMENKPSSAQTRSIQVWPQFKSAGEQATSSVLPIAAYDV